MAGASVGLVSLDFTRTHITPHALQRWRERGGGLVNWQAERRIRQTLQQAQEIRLRPAVRVNVIIDNDYLAVRYFLSEALVFVVEEYSNTLVTVRRVTDAVFHDYEVVGNRPITQ